MTENVIKTSCMPVIPSVDIEKSLRFWTEGLGLTMDREIRQEGRLIGCMVQNKHIRFWLNQRDGTPIKPKDYESIRLYWAPSDIHVTRVRLKQLGYEVSDIVDRSHGRLSSFVTDEDVTPIVLAFLLMRSKC